MSGPKKKQISKQAAAIQLPPKNKPFYSTPSFLYSLLFVFGCLLYINTIHHDFAYDDVVVVSGNRFTLEGFKGIPSLFKNDLFAGASSSNHTISIEGGRYRP